MRSKTMLALSIALLTILVSPAVLAETEAPDYEDAISESPSVEDELNQAQPEGDYGDISDAMDQLSIQNGDVVTAPSEEYVPLEEEIPEEGDYGSYEE